MATKAFDPDKFLAETAPKSGFDPDKFLAETEHLQPKETDRSFDPMAALQGYGNAATFGYLPQLQGMAGAATDIVFGDPNAEVDAELRKQGFTINAPKGPSGYLEHRDAAVQRQDELAAASPVSYGAGSVLGAVALPGLATAKAAKAAQSAGMLVNAGKAAGYGALTGALENPGDVKGEMGLQLDERLQGAKMGAALGGAGVVGGKVLEKAGSAIASAGKNLASKANIKAFDALGGVLKSQKYNASRMVKSDASKVLTAEEIANNVKPEMMNMAEKIGRTLKESGIVKPGATFDDIAVATAKNAEESGKEIGDIYKAVTAQVKNPEVMSSLSPEVAKKVYDTTFKPTQWANEMKESLKNKYKGRGGFSNGVSKVESFIDDIAQYGDESDILAMQQAKVDAQNLINFEKLQGNGKIPPGMEIMDDIRNDLSERIQNHISALDEAFGSKKIDQLRKANERYSVFAEANNIVQDRLNRERVNRTFGLIDTGLAAPSLVGAAGDFSQGDFEGGAKKVALAGATAVASRTARRYGNPVMSSAYGLASKMAGVPGQPVGQAMMKAGQVLVNNPMLTAVITNELERDKNTGYLDRLGSDQAALNSNIQKAMGKTKDGELAAIAGVVNYGQNQFGSLGHYSQIVKDYGEKDARKIMSELGSIKGNVTKEKIENLPIPQDKKQRLVNDLTNTVMNEASGRKITVNPDMISDIRNSGLSPIEKAKALNSFNQTGQVTDHTIAKTLSGVKSVEPVVVPPGSNPRALEEKKARLGRAR